MDPPPPPQQQHARSLRDTEGMVTTSSFDMMLEQEPRLYEQNPPPQYEYRLPSLGGGGGASTFANGAVDTITTTTTNEQPQQQHPLGCHCHNCRVLAPHPVGCCCLDCAGLEEISVNPSHTNHHHTNTNNNNHHTARTNDADTAEFTHQALKVPFAKGNFRYAALGHYVDGPNAGVPCVAKWFKNHNDRLHDDFLEKDLDAMDVAHAIVQEWNKEHFIDQTIQVNLPERWKFAHPNNDTKHGRFVLVEPFIENFVKFNSNTGWNNSMISHWPSVLQSLSHFSYHISHGRYLLCDCQGGVYKDRVILTDPVILSRNGEFGRTDLGYKGIASFFHAHVCTLYCQNNWIVPRHVHAYFAPTPGTLLTCASVERPPTEARKAPPGV